MSPPPTPPPALHSRTDLADLKSQISRRLGPDRAQRYFVLLNRLLCQKLSKFEFDKLCFATIGRDNIPLHNQFIRSILRNAHQSTAPPPPSVHLRPAQKLDGASAKKLSTPAPSPPVWSNGEFLPPSPRKSRSTNRRIKDRPSPLGPNGKTDALPLPPLPSDEANIRENGHLKKTANHLHAKIQIAEKPSNSIDEQDADQAEFAQYDRGPIRAPLGIPFCAASVGGARHLSPLSPCTSSSSTFFGGELRHTEALRKRMEQIAEAQGLGGVSTDCANLLNNGLDEYLKRLIRSCVDLAETRSGIGSTKQAFFKNQAHLRNGIGSLEAMHDRSASLLDFRVAMELNPQQLGEDWPLLLEKLCTRSFEE